MSILPRPEWVSDDLVADRGEHAGFQMYTREGNDAVGQMVEAVVRGIREGEYTSRNAITDALKAGVKRVEKAHPEVHDTEPPWAIVDAVNPVLYDAGFRSIETDDLYDW